MYGKIFGALLTVGLVSAGMGYATFAFFTDTETATDNIFTAGDLDLHLDGVESITGTFVSGNIAPGDVISDSITLTNDGSIFDGDAEGHTVDLDMRFTATTTDDPGNVNDPDDGGASADALETFLEVTSLTYDGATLLTSVTDANANGWLDLADLETAGVLADLADPLAAGKDLAIELTFRTEGGNDLKRDSVDLDIEFFLAQTGEPDLS